VCRSLTVHDHGVITKVSSSAPPRFPRLSRHEPFPFISLFASSARCPPSG